MQAQIKQKTMQFKSIDSTIQIIDDPTNPIEISGRCGQTDATIASILGNIRQFAFLLKNFTLPKIPGWNYGIPNFVRECCEAEGSAVGLWSSF